VGYNMGLKGNQGYSAFLTRKRYYDYAKMWLEKQIGLIGIFVKKLSPDIYSKIKILKTLESYSNTAENSPIYFFFIDSVSNAQIAKNDFLTIQENGYKLKDEITKRRKRKQAQTGQTRQTQPEPAPREEVYRDERGNER
jgi:hypothetical protein